MKSSQLMSLIVIAVMIASSLGFAMLAAQGSPTAKPPPSEPPPISSPTVLAFSAEDIDAEVVEIFSSMVLTAKTPQAEIEKIDAELSTTPGIGRFTSRYRLATQEELSQGGLTYIADVYMKPGYAALDIVEFVSENSRYLTSVQGGVSGLVELPKKVTFENKQLDVKRMHEFEDRLVQAYLSVDSRKGDRIKVSLDAEFSGEQISKLLAFEVYNENTAPVQHTITATFTIASLEPRLRVVADINYTYMPDEDALRSEISSVQGVQGLELDVSDPYPVLYLEFDRNVEELRSDINAALFAVAGVEDVRFYSARDAANIDFDLSADFSRLKSDITAAVESAGAKLSSLKDPRVNLLADLNTSPTDALAVSDSIKALLAPKNIDAKVYQYAAFDANALQSADGNRTYALRSGSFNGFAQPGHSIGSAIQLEVFFVSIRDRATSINASEPEKG